MNNADIEIPRPERLETSFRIFVDQAGYLPTAEKTAVFTFPAGYYSVINETGSICFSGIPVPAGADEASGETLFKADFSRLTAPGTYRIISGTDFSPVFRIGEDVYKNCFDDCMKAFYFQRCGCALEEKYAGMWTHEKCHSAPAVLWEDHSVKLDVTGGWHDAGDYGKYVTAAAAALAHLLYAWKMFPEAFRRQDLNIPGKPSNMPDILIECRWELEWLLKMQRFDGAVWHKATTAKHAAFVMPEDDREQMYVLPVSSNATADFAAVTALASGIYREFDKAFSGRLLKSSCAAGRDILDEAKSYAERINSEKEQLFADYEKEIYDTVMQIAKKVTLDSITSKDSAAVKRLIKKAAKEFRNCERVKITLNDNGANEELTGDYEYLKELCGGIPNVEVELLPEADPGTVIVDNGSEIVDAGIMTQLRMIQELGDGKFREPKPTRKKKKPAPEPAEEADAEE